MKGDGAADVEGSEVARRYDANSKDKNVGAGGRKKWTGKFLHQRKKWTVGKKTNRKK